MWTRFDPDRAIFVMDADRMPFEVGIAPQRHILQIARQCCSQLRDVGSSTRRIATLLGASSGRCACRFCCRLQSMGVTIALFNLRGARRLRNGPSWRGGFRLGYFRSLMRRGRIAVGLCGVGCCRATGRATVRFRRQRFMHRLRLGRRRRGLGRWFRRRTRFARHVGLAPSACRQWAVYRRGNGMRAGHDNRALIR